MILPNIPISHFPHRKQPIPSTAETSALPMGEERLRPQPDEHNHFMLPLAYCFRIASQPGMCAFIARQFGIGNSGMRARVFSKPRLRLEVLLLDVRRAIVNTGRTVFSVTAVISKNDSSKKGSEGSGFQSDDPPKHVDRSPLRCCGAARGNSG